MQGNYSFAMIGADGGVETEIGESGREGGWAAGRGGVGVRVAGGMECREGCMNRAILCPLRCSLRGPGATPRGPPFFLSFYLLYICLTTGNLSTQALLTPTSFWAHPPASPETVPCPPPLAPVSSAATYTSWECGPEPGSYLALAMLKLVDSDGNGESWMEQYRHSLSTVWRVAGKGGRGGITGPPPPSRAVVDEKEVCEFGYVFDDLMRNTWWVPAAVLGGDAPSARKLCRCRQGCRAVVQRRYSSDARGGSAYPSLCRLCSIGKAAAWPGYPPHCLAAATPLLLAGWHCSAAGPSPSPSAPPPSLKRT